MRVTNQMVTNSSLRNMQKSMQRVAALNEQVTSGKKISKPSEDPVVAIRALKLRTTCDQLEQYKNKNIKDAMNWLSTTETSIENVFSRLDDVYKYCVQGSTDTFETKDRNTIINDLYAMKEAIYAEGGMTYAGRYLFSGYKTETNLLFQDNAAKANLSYNITEELSSADIEVKNVVLDEIDLENLDGAIAGAYTSPTSESVYKLRLAYSNLDNVNVTLTVKDADGNEITVPTPTMKAISDSADYYKVGDDEINYIPETGELIFGKNVNEAIKNAASISINYDKSEFAVNDLRPEMYFNCTQYKTDDNGVRLTGDENKIDFTVSEEGQQIKYEVNFKQYVTVNAEGKDFIKHGMGNRIEDLALAVQDVLDIENTIAKLKQKLDDPKYKGDEAAEKQINKMLEDADIELALKKENMQKLFGNNITHFQNFMEDVSAVQARVGTTYSKMKLIQVRVDEQLADFKELKSSNEDVETEEAAIDLYQSELVYESALATTASVIKKTLLDYI